MRLNPIKLYNQGRITIKEMKHQIVERFRDNEIKKKGAFGIAKKIFKFKPKS